MTKTLPLFHSIISKSYHFTIQIFQLMKTNASLNPLFVALPLWPIATFAKWWIRLSSPSPLIWWNISLTRWFRNKQTLPWTRAHWWQSMEPNPPHSFQLFCRCWVICAGDRLKSQWLLLGESRSFLGRKIWWIRKFYENFMRIRF